MNPFYMLWIEFLLWEGFLYLLYKTVEKL